MYARFYAPCALRAGRFCVPALMSQRAPVLPIRPPAPRPPTEEVVTVGSWGWLARLWQTLPPYLDDVTRDFGADLYSRMQADPQVASSVRLLKLAVLAEPVQLDLPDDVPDGDPRRPLAETIRTFCAANLARVQPALTPTLYSLLDALTDGHKTAEIVYELGTLPGGPGQQLLLKAIKPKPAASLALVVDRFQTLLGWLYPLPGQLRPTLGQGGTDGPLPPNFLPRDRAVHLVWAAPDGDPRGSSLLRAVYRAWWSKQQMWPGHLATLATFAQPSLWGTTAEGAAPIPTVDADGTIIGYTDPVTHMLTQLQNIRNGAAGAGPYGSDVKVLQAQGVGTAFENAVDLYNREIATGILGAARATQEAQHGSRADSQTAQDVIGVLINYIRQLLSTTLKTDLLTPLVRLNYGDAGAALVPHVRLTATEQQDFAADAAAIAALERVGFLTPSQKPGLDTRLGLPIRTPDEQAQEAARAAAPPIPPAVPQVPGNPSPQDTPPPQEGAPNG